MLSNPLIERYRYSLLRPKQVWVFLAVYFVIVAVIIFYNVAIYKYQRVFDNVIELYKALFYQFLILQAVILWIWGGYNSGVALKEETARKSYDFFRMLPVSAGKKGLGVVIGKNLMVLLLSVLNLVFVVFFGGLAVLSWSLLGQIILVLFSVALLFSFTSLMVSIHRGSGQSGRTGLVALVVFGLFLIVPLVGWVVQWSSDMANLEKCKTGFFTLKVPVLVFSAIAATYYALWVFKGITRSLTFENDPLFSRGGGVGFLLTHIVVMLGLVWPYFEPKNFPAPTHTFWLITLFPLFFIPLGSAKTFERYLEEFGGTAGAGLQGVGSFLVRSNLCFGLGLGGFWAASSLVVGIASGLNPVLALHAIAVILSFCLVLLLLLELYILHVSAYNKIGILVAVLVGGVLLLPLLLMAIFSQKPVPVHMFCLPGFWGELCGNEKNSNQPLFNVVLAYNLALSIVPLWLIFRRYQFIVTARWKM